MKSKLSFLLFLLYTGLVFPQTENSEQSQSTGTKNIWALQFQVLENFKISTFEGSTISLKKVLSDCSSLRLGVSINTTISDIDGENKTTTAKNSQDNDQISLNINSLYLWNTHIKSDVSAYFGFGPTLSIGHSKITSKNEGSNDVINTTIEDITTQNTFGIGASGVVGIEWFVKDNISILGEYETVAIYNHTKTKTEVTNNNSDSNYNFERKENTFRFSSVGAKLGVSIYF